MTINAYPLQWPVGWKRTESGARQPARFSGTTSRYVSRGDGSGYTSKQSRDLTIAEGRKRVLDVLTRMGLSRDDVVLSTNLPLRLDGEPRGDAREPADPGVAVYWEDAGARRVMAIDIYDRVADNLAAVAATLDAMRAIERHGGAVILERAFTGFTALPAPGQGAARTWWEVLQVPRQSTREAVKHAYRKLASQFHPDKPGGSHAAMSELNAAQEAALQECFT
jgi:DnaJ domain